MYQEEMLPASTHFSSIFMSSSIKEHRKGKLEVKMLVSQMKFPMYRLMAMKLRPPCNRVILTAISHSER